MARRFSRSYKISIAILVLIALAMCIGFKFLFDFGLHQVGFWPTLLLTDIPFILLGLFLMSAAPTERGPSMVGMIISIVVFIFAVQALLYYVGAGLLKIIHLL